MQHKNFFMVPNRIFDLELKPRDFAVYCCLLRHSDSKDGSCFPSRRVIAKECGMDRKTVDSAIENLSSLDLVKKIQRHREDGTRTSNLYYVASLLEQSKSFIGQCQDFLSRRKPIEQNPGTTTTEKREQITSTECPCVAHRPPVCRRRQRCEEHSPKNKIARLGRFESKVETAKYGVIQGSFQAFSMGRKSSRRKSRGRKRPSTRITAAGNPDRTRVFGILDTEKVRCHKRGLVPVYGATDPRKCRV